MLTSPTNLITPDDPSYDEARTPWNLAADQRPAAVAVPESVQDVIEAVQVARANGHRVAPQGTGHGASNLDALDDTVLVRTTRMRDVRIDPVECTARVGAGAEWQDVTHPAAEHGLAALAGSSPNVGVAGYVLGGGLSWLARRYGLASNSVKAIELVTADGYFVRADHEHEPDLFWALRGGGGNFGVVTAIEIGLFPVQDVYGGVLFFPMERAGEVLPAWRDWARTMPDEVTSVGRLLHPPDLPLVPEPLRDVEFVVVEAVAIGDAAEGAALIEPLRELGPVMDTFAAMKVPELQTIHMDPEPPVPGHGDGALLPELTDDAIDALLGVAGTGTQSPLLSYEFRHLGGAVAVAPPGGGAVASLDGEFQTFAVGMTPTPEIAAAVGERLDAIDAAMAPYAGGHAYANFCDRPGASKAERWFDADTHQRLLEIKAQVDPTDVFLGNHTL